MQCAHEKLNPEFPCKSSIFQEEVSLHEQTRRKSQAKMCEMLYWELCGPEKFTLRKVYQK